VEKEKFSVTCMGKRLCSGWMRATTLCYDGMKKHTFGWQEGSLFALPHNCWYQRFNGQTDQHIRYVGVTTGPLCINFFFFHRKSHHQRSIRSYGGLFSGKGFRKNFLLPTGLIRVTAAACAMLVTADYEYRPALSFFPGGRIS
jgi:hypothetical protein